MNPDMSLFENKSTRTVILKNYTNLFTLLAGKNINFDSNLAQSIIKEESGAAYSLLYQLYIIHDTIKNPINIDLYRSTGKKVKDMSVKINNKNTTKKSIFDEQFFNKTLQMKIQSDKHRALYEKVTKKYLDEKDKYYEATHLQKKIEEESKMYKHAMMRNQEIEKLRVNNEFMKDWWTHGLEEHAKNLNIRKENELKELKNKMKIEEKKKTIKDIRVKDSIKEANENIENFERDIIMSQFKIDNESSKLVDLDSIKDRTSRMRKSLNDEINSIFKIEQQRREDEYVDFLTKRSKDEHAQG